MNVPWGRLINAALDAGLEPEDALIAVLRAARMIEDMGYEFRPDTLSDREREVLAAMTDDLSYAHAVRETGLAMGTVREYAKRARQKLGVHTTREAVEAVRAA